MHTNIYSEILQAIIKILKDILVYTVKVRAIIFGFSICSSESGNEHMVL